MKKLYAFLLAILVTACAFAQAPSKMTYQAVIRNSSNQLVTSQSVGMRISILQGSVTGTGVYTETQTPTTNANGLVTIEIGGGTGFNTIDWSNGPYFIKTETDPTGGTNYTISGTSQLLSVPYALGAKNAENGFASVYSDGDKRAVLDANGNFSFGKPKYTSPKMQVNGSTVILPGKYDWGAALFIDATPVSGGDTWGLYSFGDQSTESAGSFIITNTSESSLLIMDKSGRIGIGNVNPAYKLDVSGDINFTGSLYKNGSLFSGVTNWSEITNKPTTVSGYGITDAMTTAHAANGITSANINNWNTAFGWGNHTGLYRPINYVPAWSEITSNPFAFSLVANNQLIKYNSTSGKWENWTPNYLTSFTETDPLWTSASANYYTKTNMQTSGAAALHFNNLTNKPTTLAGYGITDADPSITNEIQELSLSGTNLTLSKGGGTVTLPSSGGGDNWGTQSAVTDATLSGNGTTATPLKIAQQSATSGQVLKWNGTSWLPGTDLSGGSGWSLTGNSGTSAGTNFIGTTDNVPLTFKTNNQLSGKIDHSLYNTSIGYRTLGSNTSGWGNTAMGDQAIFSNTTGSHNTASGDSSLYANTTGNFNTATGSYSLSSNSTGNENTADGGGSLFSNTTGYMNTATGTYALFSNTTGSYNVANGYLALSSNKANSRSTAIGSYAMYYADDRATGRETFNTAVGYEALKGSITPANNTGQNNTAVGDQALLRNTAGNNNTAIGLGALASNSTGINNIAQGSWALYNSTTGSNNTAIGLNTLIYNIANSRSTAIGYNAMYYADNRTTGRETFNTAVGYEALKGSSTPAKNTSQWNTAIGDQALYSNTAGNYNVANGAYALFFNTTGEGNVANGVYALYSNTTGEGNVATGASALHDNKTGDRNEAYGINALGSNTTGMYNVAIGNGTLYSNTTGSYNTACGNVSLNFNVANSRSTAIGYGAMFYADDRTTGRETFNTAVGFKALMGSFPPENNTGQWNTAIGDSALYSNTYGNANTAIGVGALSSNIGGYSNTAIGYGADAASAYLANITAIGYNTKVDASNKVRIGNTSVSSIGGQVGWTAFSDGRFKKNINENVPGLEFIKQLRPITYNLDISSLNADINKNRPTTLREGEKAREESADEKAGIAAQEKIVYTGFVAQEVEAVAKKIGYDFSGVDAPQNPDGHYGLRYAEFVVPLVKAVQEQQQIIEELKNTIEQLQLRVEQLEGK
jgi:trimeric autotransporter adhesin